MNDRDAGLKIETRAWNFGSAIDGRAVESTKQHATVPVTLNGQTREVEIERYSKEHCWHATNLPTVFRFRTGSKTHVRTHPLIAVSGGRGRVAAERFNGHRNLASPVCFATDETKASGWSGR